MPPLRTDQDAIDAFEREHQMHETPASTADLRKYWENTLIVVAGFSGALAGSVHGIAALTSGNIGSAALMGALMLVLVYVTLHMLDWLVCETHGRHDCRQCEAAAERWQADDDEPGVPVERTTPDPLGEAQS